MQLCATVMEGDAYQDFHGSGVLVRELVLPAVLEARGHIDLCIAAPGQHIPLLLCGKTPR